MRDLDQQVLLFSTPSCDFCAAARSFLTRRQIEYVELDVSQDEEAMRQLIWMTGRAMVPTLLVGDKTVIGFDPDRLTSLFEPKSQEDAADADWLPGSDGG